MGLLDEFWKSVTEVFNPARGAQIRERSERRAWELINEFPNADDAFIANLMRDELTNMRTPHREYYAWATTETVGRIRRTAMVSLARSNFPRPPG